MINTQYLESVRYTVTKLDHKAWVLQGQTINITTMSLVNATAFPWATHVSRDDIYRYFVG